MLQDPDFLTRPARVPWHHAFLLAVHLSVSRNASLEPAWVGLCGRLSRRPKAFPLADPSGAKQPSFRSPPLLQRCCTVDLPSTLTPASNSHSARLWLLKTPNCHRHRCLQLPLSLVSLPLRDDDSADEELRPTSGHEIPCTVHAFPAYDAICTLRTMPHIPHGRHPAAADVRIKQLRSGATKAGNRLEEHSPTSCQVETAASSFLLVMDAHVIDLKLSVTPSLRATRLYGCREGH